MAEAAAESISGFIAYISQFDDQFVRHIKGATEAEVDRLEQVVRHPLPAQYRDFLRHMGNGSDRLVFAGECQTNIASLMAYYQSVSDEPDPSIPDGCLAIGAYCISSDEMCLDSRGGGTPTVIVMYDGDFSFYAQSLIHLLYGRGFVTYRLPALPYFKFFTDEGQEPGTQKIGTRASFERAGVWASTAPWSCQWFSDATSLCVEGKGAGGDALAFCLTYFDKGGYTLHIGGEREGDLAVTAGELSRVIGVPLTESTLD